MEYSGARGTLIHEKKKLKSEISCETPFKECKKFQGSIQPAYVVVRV